MEELNLTYLHTLDSKNKIYVDEHLFYQGNTFEVLTKSNWFIEDVMLLFVTTWEWNNFCVIIKIIIPTSVFFQIILFLQGFAFVLLVG